MKIHRAFTIDRTPEELYRFWRDMRNLAPLVPGDTTVTEHDSRTSHWVAKGPGGRHYRWDTQITVDNPGREIAWRSMPGGDVQNSGSVRFDPAEERTTRVSLDVEFTPPGALVGRLVEPLVRDHVESEIDAGLERIRRRLATAGSPSIAGSKPGA